MISAHQENSMIVVTGATGHLGHAVVQQLLTRIPGDRIVATVRDPRKATALIEQGVQVRQADFADPASLTAAFEGAAQVLVISTDSIGERVELHRAAIEAARRAGARRVLYTSHMGSGSQSLFPPMPDHAATEAILSGLGLPFTSLRHGFYAASALGLMRQGLETGELLLPEDGKVSWTSHADLAEADAILLADEGHFDGITPPLTALETFDMADLAAIASDLTGREIKRITVPDDAWRETMISHGTAAPVADLLVGLFRAARRGEFAAVDPTLETLLGRRPQTMRDVLAATLKG
jgi:uncharacterized protein YbjT (DUF2867 family)